MARAKVEREGACRIGATVCLNSLGVDAAHLIPRSRIPGPECMAESNIVPLCRAHHTAFDAGRLDLLPFLTRDEQAYATFLVGIHEAYTRLTGQAPVLREFEPIGRTATPGEW